MSAPSFVRQIYAIFCTFVPHGMKYGVFVGANGLHVRDRMNIPGQAFLNDKQILNMKRSFQILACAIAGLLLATDALGQAQITTRREKLKDFTSKTTKVVLTGDEFLDEALKESVASTWTVSPYEFCTNEEFQGIKTNDNFYFLMVVKGQFRRESEPGIDLLTLVKGGEGAENPSATCSRS